jgi:hypothetical protein
MSNRVDLEGADLSEEYISSMIRVARIDEIGTTLAGTSN